MGLHDFVNRKSKRHKLKGEEEVNDLQKPWNADGQLDVYLEHNKEIAAKELAYFLWEADGGNPDKPLDQYLRQAEIQLKLTTSTQKSRWRRLVDFYERSWFEKGLETIDGDLQRMALLDLLNVLGSLGVIIAVITFLEPRNNVEKRKYLLHGKPLQMHPGRVVTAGEFGVFSF